MTIKTWLLKSAVTALLFLGVAATALSQITVDATTSWDHNAGNGTLDASGSDKLVVVITGEHHFGNTNGSISGVTYDGAALTQATNLDPVDNTSITASDVWYLDDPSTSTGTIVVSKGGNNFVYTAFALSGTDPGVGNWTISALDQRSVDLTTSADNSLVLAYYTMGGNHTNGGTTGNQANVGSVDADVPLTEQSALEIGSNWCGHVTGTANVATAGAGSYSFTGGSQLGVHTIAVEFLADTSPPDVTPPTLTSTDIVDDQAGGPISDATTVSYTVTFSEDMDASSIGTDDFEDAGTSGATIDSVSGSGAVYTVTATPGGAGTLQLQVKALAVLTDQAGNALDTASAIADDTIITVNADVTAPTLASTDIVDDQGGGPILDSTQVIYTVTFSEDMNASTVDVTDFENAGSPAATIDSVTGSGAVYTVTVTPGAGSGTLQLQVKSGATLTDLIGNPLDTASAIADDTVITVNADVPPTLAGTDIVDDQGGAAVTDPATVVYTVTFSEDMNPATIGTDDFENAGTAPVTIDSVSGTNDVYTVSVTTGGAGSLQLQVKALAVLEDTTGNALDTAAAIADDTTITVNAETTPPTLAATDIVDGVGGGDIYETQSVTYTITFSEDMNAPSIGLDDFENGGTAPTTIDTISGFGAVYSVTVSPTGPGTLQLQVKAGAVLTDVAGNALDTAAAITDDTIITVLAGSPPVRLVPVVDGSTSWDKNSEPGIFDASGSDKLVVLITGEHHFGNTNGSVSGVTYNGEPLVQAINVDPEGSNNIQVNDIWYLDNPGDFTGSNEILVSRGGNNFVYTAIALSSTAPGVGATAISGTPSKSVDLATITDNSLVIAVHSMGGDHTNGGTTGNQANVTAVDADAPATEVSALEIGSNWCGHVTSTTDVASAGLATYSFTGGSNVGTRTIAAEFQGAIPENVDYDNWAAQFAPADLTDPNADLDGDGLTNNDERLFGLDPTDPSSQNPYAVPLDSGAGTFSFTRRDNALTGLFSDIETSTDLQNWTVDTGAVLVEGVVDGNGVETVSVTLSAALLSNPKLFVRVNQNEGVALSEDFESGDGGFTATGTPNDWAYGTPNSNNDFNLVVSGGNNSSTGAWGTSLGDGSVPSGLIDTAADSILRSPDIDLTDAGGAELDFAAAVDAQTGDAVQVIVRNAGDDSALATFDIVDTSSASVTADWTSYGPFDLAAAAGSTVYLEFRFAGSDAAFIGLYIDDVAVTKTP